MHILLIVYSHNYKAAMQHKWDTKLGFLTPFFWAVLPFVANELWIIHNKI